MYAFLTRTGLTFFVLTFLYQYRLPILFSRSLSLQLFVIVVWNFELYMIPLALLLPLVWNYILITSGKDTRQDVVSNLIAYLVSLKTSFHTEGREKSSGPFWKHSNGFL